MTDYFDSHGHLVRLGKKLGSGGEGAVFEVQGDARLVAKIYHRPAKETQAEKLEAMTLLATEELLRFAALPIATLSQIRSGPVAGMVMPRVRDQAEIHTLYSPAHRKTHSPDKDWGFLIHVALNVAAVFDSLHEKSIVIGDVNQGNVLVSSRGTVTLIDCDSFQVSANGRVYSCEVGVAHFTPPELQGQSFHGTVRTANHDLFGLAILIFHLLCMGRHPFAGRFTGMGEPPPLEKAIEQFRYAYSRNVKTNMLPPPQTLMVPAVMPALAELFERAFTKGSELSDGRPTATEWHAALRDLKLQLKPCAADLGHKYPNYLGTCPWCALEREGAPNLFASVTAHLVDRREGELNASLDPLWKPLLDLRQAAIDCVLQKVSFQNLHVTANPIPAEIEQNQSFALLLGRCFLGIVALLAVSWWIPPMLYIATVLSIGFGIWWFVLNRYYGLQPEIDRRERRLRESIAQLRVLESAGATELDSLRLAVEHQFHRLDLTKAEIEGLRPRYQADLDALNLQRERRQLDAYLQSHLIRSTTISFVNDWQKSTLESFGIETAYDLNEIRLANINGLSQIARSALLDWKAAIQKKFKFRPREKIPNVDRNTILARYLRQREDQEQALMSGRSSLELLYNQLQEVRSRYQQRLDIAAQKAKQAEADVLSLPE
jgi:DNA-binding helix-hairpin-helix protein with protein kinase domain